jgi:hypothetical protein
VKKIAIVTAGGVVALLVHAWIVHGLLSAGNVLGAFIAVGFGAIALGGIVALATRRVPMVVVMILCGFLGSFFTGYTRDSLDDLDAQLRPDNVRRDVAVDGFGAEPPGRVIYLRESYVRAELVGGAEHQRKQGHGRVSYRVAPIAPPGWTEDDPVVAWAAFRTNDSMIGGYSESEGLAEWAKASRAGFVADRTHAKYQEAIADAERQHGLRSAPDAPLLQWRSPEAERTDRRNRFVLALLATQALWIVSTLGAWGQAFASRKSASTSA